MWRRSARPEKRRRRIEGAGSEDTAEPGWDTATPEEALEASCSALRNALADEPMEKVKFCTPAFFERQVVEVLVAMGYGGSLADASEFVAKRLDAPKTPKQKKRADL